MRQDVVAQRVLAELLELKVVQAKDEDIVWVYLHWVYAGGFDEGRMQYHKRRPVVQMDKITGAPIRVFQSASIAARKYGLSKTGISKACLNANRTAGGYIWKYLEDLYNGKNNDSGKGDGAGNK